MSTSDEDRPGHAGENKSLFVDAATLRALNDPDKEIVRDADAVLRTRCTRYVLMFRGSLNNDDVEDVVSAAFADVYPLLRSSSESVEFINEEMRKALERHRKATKRLHMRQIRMPDTDAWSLRRAQDLHISKELSIHLARVVEKIEPTLHQSLHLLPSRDRSIIIYHYKLPFKLSRASAKKLDALSAAAYRKALWRARQRFFQCLDQLADTLDEASREAVRLLLHGDLQEILETAPELQEKK